MSGLWRDCDLYVGGRGGFACSVALLPYYENAGSALKFKSNHMLNSLLFYSPGSLSLLEERTRTNVVQTVLTDCTKKRKG